MDLQSVVTTVNICYQNTVVDCLLTFYYVYRYILLPTANYRLNVIKQKQHVSLTIVITLALVSSQS